MERLRKRAGKAPWGAAAWALVLGASLFSASAFIGTPAAQAIPIVDDILGVGKDAISTVVETVFDLFVEKLFGGVPADIATGLVQWLVTLPVPRTGTALVQLQENMTAAAWGGLALVMTLAIGRYWLSGLTSGGGYEALQGLGRGLGAAGMLLLWPYIYVAVVRLVNSLSSGILKSGGVKGDTTDLFQAALGSAVASGANPVFFLLPLLAAIMGVVLVVVLFAMKVVVAAALAVLFVAMPLAIVLWPLPETAWLGRIAGRAFVGLSLWPVAWVLCFAVFAAIGSESLTPKGEVAETLVEPFVAIAMLYVLVKLPLFITDAALMVGSPQLMGGVTGRITSSVVSSVIVRKITGFRSAQRHAVTPTGTMGGPSTGGTRPNGGAPRDGGGPGGGGRQGGGSNTGGAGQVRVNRGGFAGQKPALVMMSAAASEGQAAASQREVPQTAAAGRAADVVAATRSEASGRGAGDAGSARGAQPGPTSHSEKAQEKRTSVRSTERARDLKQPVVSSARTPAGGDGGRKGKSGGAAQAGDPLRSVARKGLGTTAPQVDGISPEHTSSPGIASMEPSPEAAPGSMVEAAQGLGKPGEGAREAPPPTPRFKSRKPSEEEGEPLARRLVRLQPAYRA